MIRAMDDAVRYRIRTPQVASQSLQGESVLINFESGCYYSAEGLGSIIITLLEQGATVGEIVDHLGVGGELRSTIRAFVAELEREELIAPALEAGPGGRARQALPVDSGAGPPVLRKFSDLQDLLLLDPIHESGDAGWPWPPGVPPQEG